MNEIWKDIKGYEGLYQVSSWGNVKGKKGILKPYITEKGYLKVGLFKDGKNHKKRVNRLVAEAFIPNPLNLPQVNHKDGNKKNNSVSNLEYCTNSENRNHAENMRNGVYVEITHKVIFQTVDEGQIDLSDILGEKS